MSVVDVKAVRALDRAVTTAYQIEFDKTLSQLQDFNDMTMEIPTDSLEAKVVFTNHWNGLEQIEFNENVPQTSVTGEIYTIYARRYAKSVWVPKYDYKSPSSQAIIMNNVRAMAREASVQRARRIAYILANGDSTAVQTYDSVNLFSDSHTLNGVTWDNLQAGALSASTFETAKQKLRQIPLGPGGSYLPTENANFWLIVPPALEKDARLILNNQYLYDQTGNSTGVPATNPYANAAKLVVSSLLTDSNDWYMILDLPSIKPFATVRSADSTGALVSIMGENDKDVANLQIYQWFVNLIEETYPIHYYLMIKVVNS
jgi:phage major head subunit gpT-like protein